MSFWCDYGLDDIGDNGASGGTLSDLWALLVMTGSTVATERSANFIGDYADLQEYDDMSYSRVNLTGVTFTLNTVSHQKELHCDPIPWTALDAASNPAIGVLIFRKVTNDSDSIPWGFFNGAPTFPFNGVGDDVELTEPSAGFLQLRN